MKRDLVRGGEGMVESGLYRESEARSGAPSVDRAELATVPLRGLVEGALGDGGP